MFNEPPTGGLIKHLMSSYNANKKEKVERKLQPNNTER